MQTMNRRVSPSALPGHALEAEEPHAAWVLARRPLLLLLVLACCVSVAASGRFTLRLIVDGAVSFAFVPLSELLAFAIVYRLRRPSIRFSQAVDRFFAGNTPWLWWWVAIMAGAMVMPVLRHGSLLPLLLVSAPVPIVLSIAFDLRFFRDVMHATRGRAVVDAVVQRSVAWSAGTAYFIGIASSSRDFLYLFVEMKDLLVSFASENLR
jgi:hypothetical protein